MTGYSCDQCEHMSCFIMTEDISDNDCQGIQKGHVCKPMWEWQAPDGVADPRYGQATPK